MTSLAETVYLRSGDRTDEIKGLVLEHLPLVRRIVQHFLSNPFARASMDDLIGAGTVGLVEAAHRFDPSQGVKFQTFAYPRVRGAVVDHLRKNDRLGKSARTQLKALRRHMQDFCKEHGQKPEIAELARMAGMSEETALKYLSYEKWDCVTSLDSGIETADGEENLLGSLVADGGRTPLEELEQSDRIERLTRAIEELPERQKQIIVMYYYEDLYMAEMAEVLGVSESRVSQLHSRAVYELGRKLEEEE